MISPKAGSQTAEKRSKRAGSPIQTQRSSWRQWWRPPTGRTRRGDETPKLWPYPGNSWRQTETDIHVLFHLRHIHTHQKAKIISGINVYHTLVIIVFHTDSRFTVLDLPAVDEVGGGVKWLTFHWFRVICVLSCENHPVLSLLTLKHLPLLGRTHQQHKVRFGNTTTQYIINIVTITKRLTPVPPDNTHTLQHNMQGSYWSDQTTNEWIHTLRICSILDMVSNSHWQSKADEHEHTLTQYAHKLTYEVFGVGHSVEVRQEDPFNESWVNQHWSVPTPRVVYRTTTGRRYQEARIYFFSINDGEWQKT